MRRSVGLFKSSFLTYYVFRSVLIRCFLHKLQIVYNSVFHIHIVLSKNKIRFDGKVLMFLCVLLAFEGNFHFHFTICCGVARTNLIHISGKSIHLKCSSFSCANTIKHTWCGSWFQRWLLCCLCAKRKTIKNMLINIHSLIISRIASRSPASRLGYR